MDPIAQQFIKDADNFLKDGHYEEAILYYTHALSYIAHYQQNSNTDSCIFHNRANAYLAINHYDAALNDINFAITLSSEVAALYFTRAQINLAKKDYIEKSNTDNIDIIKAHTLYTAVKDYQLAATLEPNNAIYQAYAERAKKVYESLFASFDSKILVPNTPPQDLCTSTSTSDSSPVGSPPNISNKELLKIAPYMQHTFLAPASPQQINNGEISTRNLGAPVYYGVAFV